MFHSQHIRVLSCSCIYHRILCQSKVNINKILKNRWGVFGNFLTLSASARPKRTTGRGKPLPLLAVEAGMRQKATPLVTAMVAVAMPARSQTPPQRMRAKSWGLRGEAVNTPPISIEEQLNSVRVRLGLEWISNGFRMYLVALFAMSGHWLRCLVLTFGFFANFLFLAVHH